MNNNQRFDGGNNQNNPNPVGGAAKTGKKASFTKKVGDAIEKIGNKIERFGDKIEHSRESRKTTGNQR